MQSTRRRPLSAQARSSIATFVERPLGAFPTIAYRRGRCQTRLRWPWGWLGRPGTRERFRGLPSQARLEPREDGWPEPRQSVQQPAPRKASRRVLRIRRSPRHLEQCRATGEDWTRLLGDLLLRRWQEFP